MKRRVAKVYYGPWDKVCWCIVHGCRAYPFGQHSRALHAAFSERYLWLFIGSTFWCDPAAIAAEVSR